MSDPGPGQVLFGFVRHWSRRSPAAPVDQAAGLGGPGCAKCDQAAGLGEPGCAKHDQAGLGGPGCAKCDQAARGDPGCAKCDQAARGDPRGAKHDQVAARAGEASADRGRLVLVTEAVQFLTQRGLEATVNAVAHEIGIDQSGASRLIRDATAAGYLTTEPSRADGRRRRTAVTPAGETLLADAHEWQERVFDRLTAGWSARRRRDFQRAMTDLIDRSHDLT